MDTAPTDACLPLRRYNASLTVEIANLTTYDTFVLDPPYHFSVYVDYANKFTGQGETVRVELHQTADTAVADAGTAFLAAATGLGVNTEGTVEIVLHIPYDMTDFPLTPRIVRENDESLDTIGEPVDHLCVISGGM